MKFLIFILLAGFFVCGCEHLQKTATTNDPPLSPEKLAIRNNAASLLYDLLGDEKNVSKVLIVKRNSEELGKLIKAISTVADENEKQLERLAKLNPNLDLRASKLPAGETAARDAVAKTKEHDLLTTSGKGFEFNLLLTQVEALNYGWHLAQVAAENSSAPEEVQTFTAMSRGLENLYGQVVARMRASEK